ncbi:tripartite tricarboxylate transporter substrate binding protein [Ramlibacter sp. XY19]|uniref:tripartite tricarboxylate transporter substrate binding protein n=1 Tax=Ramlibacter paludis TaxID=2908000 RepID=UPI0023DAF369|nr:tripartite tricarboxylate transporter substrate-binding protein [Ramlibacter paludis]MCG2594434.1 tripartite tricarboxylate transporter substrate binding protein [Ramlibacter paludis]
MKGLDILRAAAAAAMLLACAPASAAAEAAECVVPAKQGGGFDMTCHLARDMLRAARAERGADMRITYMPGGIGAVAFDRAVSQNMSDPNVLVAFSSGSLLNLVQGKFGPHKPGDVRWLAAIGTDYGVIAVRNGSPIVSLQDLLAALRKDAGRVVFGAGGTVGSQDWVKAALLVRGAGRDHRSMRFVSFEGGGEALAALRGGHVDVFAGDASEVRQVLLKEPGAVRIIAVLSEGRLAAPFASAPTAREQGLDLVWPIVRGLYLGPGVPDADYRAWVAAIDRATASPGFAQLREQSGMYPFTLSGAALDKFVEQSADKYRALARQLNLRVVPP